LPRPSAAQHRHETTLQDTLQKLDPNPRPRIGAPDPCQAWHSTTGVTNSIAGGKYVRLQDLSFSAAVAG
jgi:hypothetical protein